MLKCVRAAAVALLVSAVCAAGVRAQGMDDEDYIKARIAHYREIGTWAKAISDELKSGKPKPAVVKTAALNINRMAKEQYGWFRPGSGPESEEKTSAKPVIWTKPAEFKAAQDRFVAESAAMLNFASAPNAAGDPKLLAPQFKALGQACSNCHNTFRKEEH
ncbi:MAG: cytochrome [Phenylobacterium sp.]|nr:cytochrome [Phenylobacterium sp.]